MTVAWALAAIRFYQRFLSPRKGFHCALRAATGGASCSAYGYTVIERHGVRLGLALLGRRLALCGHVHRRRNAPLHPRVRAQQGHCDAPCDASCHSGIELPCHADGHGIGSCLMDGLEGCACDWPSGRRSSRGPGASRDRRQLDALAERIRRRRQQRQEASARANPSNE